MGKYKQTLRNRVQKANEHDGSNSTGRMTVDIGANPRSHMRTNQVNWIRYGRCWRHLDSAAAKEQWRSDLDFTKLNRSDSETSLVLLLL